MKIFQGKKESSNPEASKTLPDPSTHFSFYKFSEKTHQRSKKLTGCASLPWNPFLASKTPHRKNQLVKWFRQVWVDILMITALFAIAFTIRATNLHIFLERSRRFPMHYSREDLWYGPASISRPREALRLSNLTAGLSFTTAPIVVILIMQIFVKNFWDMNAAILGLLKGLALMTLIQVVLKLFLGELRPHFLEVCKPLSSVLDTARNALRANSDHTLTNLVWASTSTCTGNSKEIRNAMESYPSGHTATAFTVGVFLSLYLNSKTKAFADYQTGFWKMLIIVIPILGAGVASALVVIDGNHHVHDVILSIPIGILVALMAYRAQYKSIFSHQTNHIPLSYVPSESVDEEESVEKEKFLAVKWPRKPVEEDEESGVPSKGSETGRNGNTV